MLNQNNQLSAEQGLLESKNFSNPEVWGTEQLIDYRETWAQQKDNANAKLHFAESAGKIINRIEFELSSRLDEFTVDSGAVKA